MKRNIVIFSRGRPFFGAQIVTYPLLYQLRKLYPDSHIMMIAQDPLEQYYTCLPWDINFVQTGNRKARYHAIPPDTHLVIALHHSSEHYALLSAARRVPVRIGFNNKRIFDFLWTHSIRWDINNYLALANLQLLTTQHNFDPVNAARGAMTSIARQKSSPVPHSDVVFMIGGGAGAFKRWGISNYTRLADQLIQTMGPETTFTFVAGPAEEAEIKVINNLNRQNFKLFVERSIAEIADLCLNAKLIVANDCGPSHIAQSACVPYVGIFNEHNPEWFWQRPDSQVVIPPNKQTDIQLISVEQVVAACTAVIQRDGQNSKPALPVPDPAMIKPDTSVPPYR